jgi:hypothetical protein
VVQALMGVSSYCCLPEPFFCKKIPFVCYIFAFSNFFAKLGEKLPENLAEKNNCKEQVLKEKSYRNTH